MNSRGALYAFLAASIWGGMYVVSKAVLPIIPPFTLLSLRLVLGVLAVAGTLRATGGLALLPARAAWPLLGVGVIGFGVSLGAQFVGTALSTAANGSLVTSASPAFIVLFAYLLLREPLTIPRLAALGLATAGAVVVTLGGAPDAGAEQAQALLLGNVALLVAAVTWGLYSVLAKLMARRYPVAVVTLYALAGGLLVGVPASALELARQPDRLGSLSSGAITLPVIAGVLYLGIVATAGAMVLWNAGLHLLDAGHASLFFFAQPAVGTLLGWLLLGEQLGPAFFAGGALIVAGVLLVSRQGA
jgi:drug/metabolite transporter (DMT)-like permease